VAPCPDSRVSIKLPKNYARILIDVKKAPSNLYIKLAIYALMDREN
jgi:hypothetical protein